MCNKMFAFVPRLSGGGREGGKIVSSVGGRVVLYPRPVEALEGARVVLYPVNHRARGREGGVVPRA